MKFFDRENPPLSLSLSLSLPLEALAPRPSSIPGNRPRNSIQFADAESRKSRARPLAEAAESARSPDYIRVIFFSFVKRDRASSIRDGNRRYEGSRIAPGTCRMYAKCLGTAKMSDDLQNEDNFRLRDVSSGRGANERTSSESIRDLEPRYTSRIARKVEYSVKCVSEWNHKRASMAQPVLTADAVNSMRHGSPQKQQLHEKWLARGVKVASRGSLSARDRARIICPAYPWRLLIFHGLWKLIRRLNANSLPPKSRCVARPS